MAEPAFDTLKIARELEHDYGFDAKQAEGAATMLHRHLVGNVATKDDIKGLEDKIKGLDDKIEAQGHGFADQIKALEERVILKMTVRFGGVMVAILAFFEVLNRVFPIVPG